MFFNHQVKAALTRTYNKTASALPYAPGAVKKGRGLTDDDGDENTQDDGEAEDDSDPEHDAMIKVCTSLIITTSPLSHDIVQHVFLQDKVYCTHSAYMSQRTVHTSIMLQNNVHSLSMCEWFYGSCMRHCVFNKILQKKVQYNTM